MLNYFYMLNQFPRRNKNLNMVMKLKQIFHKNKHKRKIIKYDVLFPNNANKLLTFSNAVRTSNFVQLFTSKVFSAFFLKNLNEKTKNINIT